MKATSSHPSHTAKIAVVGNHWFPNFPGGLDRYVYELIHGLSAHQSHVTLFGIDLPVESCHPHIALATLAKTEDPLPKRLWSAYQSFQANRSQAYDAVNLHFALYGLPLLPQLKSDLPVTCTFHGPWAFESVQEGNSGLNVFFKKLIEQAAYRRCDRFIVLSKAFGEILHQSYGVAWDKIHVVPGGVNIEQFKPSLSRQAARAQLGWPQDRFVLFTPRRLVNRMGLDKLLGAIAQLKETHSDLWLAVAGKGPLRHQLEQQVSELGIKDQVSFLGFLPDAQLPIAYEAADLTLMPSQGLEGFGLVLLESLACGTPALCTPVGGMPEVIYPFSPDLITDSTSTESIAEYLKNILSSTTLLPDRDACRAYAVDNFGWSKISSQVKDILLR